MNKKGTIVDLFVIIGLILFFAMGTLLYANISGQMNELFTESPALEQYNQSTSQFTAYHNSFSGIIDNGFMIFVIGVFIMAIILAARTPTHPMGFFLFLLLFATLIWLSAAFSNLYEKMSTDVVLSDTEATLTFIPLVMENLPWIVGILGVVMAIILYKTFKSQDI